MSINKGSSFSQQRPSHILLPSPAESSIKAFNSRRIRSRSERESVRQLTPHHKKMPTSSIGDVFQAAEHIFRNSLAFNYPQLLTSRPYKRELHNLWRKSIKEREYEQSKTSEIKKAFYVSNYKLGEGHSWYRGRYL